ncbi:MAG: GDP-mannose 4,6-dehydratase [Pseudomonadota bacterium]
MKKLLATGHKGFVGQAMASHLRASVQDHDVQWCSPQQSYDMCDVATVRALLEEHRPDWVLHLAAQSHVPTAMNNPAATLLVNTVGTANLLQVLTDMQFKGRLLYVSSADVYGAVPAAMLPVSETWVPAPRNPYASSKLAAEMLCLQWARSYPLDVVIARPFNHTGAGQDIQFALPAFAKAVAEIAVGRHAPYIQTGDLDVTRDFSDVRDVVAAYLLLFRRGRSNEIYNVCSGREYRLSQVLDEIMRLAKVQADTARDPTRLRPAEQRRMCGDPGKITSETGWSPVYNFEETLQQLLDQWLQEFQG